MGVFRVGIFWVGVFLIPLLRLKILYRKVFLKTCKIHKEAPVPESLFNKVTGSPAGYPATLLKEKTPMQVFSD